MSNELFHVTVCINNKNYKTLMDALAIGDISLKGIKSKHVDALQQQESYSEAIGNFSRPVDITVHGEATAEDMQTLNEVGLLNFHFTHNELPHIKQLYQL